MSNTPPQNHLSSKEQVTNETQVATQTEQVMAEHLLLGTLPKPRPEPPKTEEPQLEKGWPEDMQREIDLVIATTVAGAGVIGLFLWMGGLF